MMIPKRAKVIMIEDDADLCKGWVELFSLLGHDIVCYQRGLDALDNPGEIAQCDVLISDYYLPDINGVDIITRARSIRPNLPAFLLTGSRDAGIVEAVRKIPNCGLLHKPLNIEDIEKKIDEVIRVA